ncbi:MAG: hypothetical protein ACLFQL_07370 [Paracoccaceae bacterium]
MAATTEQQDQTAGRPIAGLVSGIAGAGLVAAALGLWVLPGASMAADLLLMKLGLSLFLGLGGLALIGPDGLSRGRKRG